MGVIYLMMKMRYYNALAYRFLCMEFSEKRMENSAYDAIIIIVNDYCLFQSVYYCLFWDYINFSHSINMKYVG